MSIRTGEQIGVGGKERVALQTAVEFLEEALAAHKRAAALERQASRDEVEARNRLNRAQKAFDLAVEEVRKLAPRGSDWGRT